MAEDNEHAVCVDAWMERSVKGGSPAELTQVFERGLSTLWSRAHQTLGEVTLMAIADRVLYGAAQRFPFLSALKIDISGPQFQEIHETFQSSSRAEVAGAIRFVLVEFLSVLGTLTADVLTPALHSALDNDAVEQMGSPMKTSSGEFPSESEGTARTPYDK